jgi:hypothetical protein
MLIESHFNLWNYFFRIRLRPVSDVLAGVWGCTDIYVCTGQGVNPYFHLSVSNTSGGWQKEWFFLKNNTDASLPVVMGKRPAF